MAQEPIDTAGLFDSDSDEDEQQEEQQTAGLSAKERLQALAQKKRNEAAAEEEQARQRKRSRREATDDDDAAGGDEGDDDNIAEPDEGPAARQSAPADDDEDEEREVVETADDRAFIDDEGANEDDNTPWAGGDDEDDDDRPPMDEAEEAEEGEDNEIDKLLSAKNRRKGRRLEGQEMSMLIDELLVKMDAAKEVDNEANKAGQPAMEKLKLLAEVEEMLSNKSLHRQLLNAGIMGSIRDWLHPLPDGSLPNIRLRTSMLRWLTELNIDTKDESRKRQLRSSKLGEIVMFYFKVPDETPANRKRAKALIQRWTEPIFQSYRDTHNEQRQADEARMAALRRERLARQRGKEAVEQEDAQAKSQLRPGQQGFRWHARIPQASQLDYVKMPHIDPALQAEAARAAGGDGGGARKASGTSARLNKKLKDMGSKGKSTGRAAVVSVEGRGIF